MTGPGCREAALGGRRRVHDPGVHHLRPVFPVAVGDRDHQRRAEGDAVAQAGADLGTVVFDLLAAAAPMPVLAARELAVDRLAVETEAGREAGEHRDDLAAVRFAGGDQFECHLAPSASARREVDRPQAPS